MKKLLLLLICLATFTNTYAQDITGQWNGVLKEINLRLVIHITKTDNGYSSTLDSPDQGATGIPVTTTTFENDTLNFAVDNLGLTYSGTFTDETFKGTFTQGALKLPLKLGREVIEKSINRPQEPKEPYPYYSEDVSFENRNANLNLAGTLTLPNKEGKFPVVILISGSGPQDRNEELLGHKPFLIISDYLTKNGIGVLRFDDRGVGKSTGNYSTATSADFASDVESAIIYLKSRKEIDATKIGLVGHSEGGVIAPMVTSKSDDVSYIALLAGTGIRGDKLLLLQQERIGRAMGISETQLQKSKEISAPIFAMIVNSTQSQDLKTDVKEYLIQEVNKLSDDEIPMGMGKDEATIKGQVDQLTSPWMIYFMKHNPATVLENVKCPVLAINGEKDLQVPPNENLSAIKSALEKGGNSKVTTIEFANLNHLFQESTTGAPSEYGTIEQTFAPVALETLSNWISEQVK